MIIELEKGSSSRENQVGVAPDANENSLSSISKSPEVNIKKKAVPQRIKFVDIYCCGAKSNPQLTLQHPTVKTLTPQKPASPKHRHHHAPG